MKDLKSKKGFKITNYAPRYKNNTLQIIGYKGSLWVRPKRGSGFSEYKVIFLDAEYDIKGNCTSIGTVWDGILPSKHNLEQADVAGEWEKLDHIPKDKQVGTEDFEYTLFDKSRFKEKLENQTYGQLSFSIECFILDPLKLYQSKFLEDAYDYAKQLLDDTRYIILWLEAGQPPIKETLKDNPFIDGYENWLAEMVERYWFERKLQELTLKGVLIQDEDSGHYKLKNEVYSEKAKQLLDHWSIL